MMVESLFTWLGRKIFFYSFEMTSSLTFVEIGNFHREIAKILNFSVQTRGVRFFFLCAILDFCFFRSPTRGFFDGVAVRGNL